MLFISKAVPSLPGTALLILAALALAACSTAPSRPAGDGSTFLASQYFQRGRAAWAAGNEANARFLVGRAVELDPTSEAVAFWRARWPADSLPASAREALARAEAADASLPGAAAVRLEPDSASARVAIAEAGPGAATGDGPVPNAGAADTAAIAPPPGAAPPAQGAPAADTIPSAPATPSVEDLAMARAGEGGAETPPPGPVVDPDELTARRAAFERARSSGRAPELLAAGRQLIDAWPQHLPSVHRVLAAWIDARAEPAASEQRVRDLLASLEFGDADYLAGKPDDTADAEWLRVWRGRFLDLLGRSAFLRGDMAQAEAALRSAENEINLRGPGDVTHLRHLASFYERRGDLRRAEAYAVAAAARDESGSGEVRAQAARLWTRTHRSTAGLEARLRAEAERVRREEHAAAVAHRRYEPLPVFSAKADDGTAITDTSLRGRVTVLVLWEPGCEDCRPVLEAVAGALPGSVPAAQGHAPVEIVALSLSGDAGAARRSAGALRGVTFATVAEPRPFARALDAQRLPVTLVVEPAGFVQYRHVGFPDDTAARQRWVSRLEWQVEGLRGLSATPRPRPTSRTRRPAG